MAKFSDEPLRFVINTHWHGDHTGGNENLGKRDVLILAHKNVRMRMRVEQFIEALDRRVPASPDAALPVVTFPNAVTFYLNGEEIHAFHVRQAHTDGDVMVQFRRSDVLHTGDVYWNGDYPFIDVDSGGSIDGILDATEVALALAGEKTRLVPGHGEISGRDSLAAYRDMLTEMRARIRRLLHAGKSLDEVLAEKPSGDYDDSWGQGFVKPDFFVTSVYRSLAH